MKIITKELVDKLPKNHDLLQYKEIDPQNINNSIYILQDEQKITIYDRTYTDLHNPGEILGVQDHINRTGNNPLIGNQKKLNIDFIDMNNTYKRKPPFVITDCCGEKLNFNYSYPSHYLCNISILAKAMGLQSVSAYLVNMP